MDKSLESNIVSLQAAVSPDESVCWPNRKGFPRSSCTAGLRVCKTGEWATDDEISDDSTVFDFGGEYLIITGVHSSRLSY